MLRGRRAAAERQLVLLRYTSVKILQEFKVMIKKKPKNHPLQIPDLADSSVDKK